MLDGKRILVVGGSSGIGLAVAKHARQNGARVIIASRKARERGAVLPDGCGEAIETLDFDITSSEEHSRLFESAGVIDHLVITVRPEICVSSFQNMDIESAKRAFEVKFWGQCRLIQAAQ